MEFYNIPLGKDIRSMAKKNVQINEHLHRFLYLEAGKKENYDNGIGIGDLAEKAIKNHFGIDETGNPIINPKDRKNRVHLDKEK